MLKNDGGSVSRISMTGKSPGFGCFNDCLAGSSNSDSSMHVPVHPTELESTGEIKELESLLASELQTLSLQERLKALDDVHCVGEELKENEEMVHRSLRAFEEALRDQKTDIYDIAVAQNREFIECKEFRLKFLRANLHDVQRSVRQMMEFLKYKAMFFGEAKLGRGILLSDLNFNDLDLMTSGLYHIQEGRDRSGRVIVYMLTHALGGAEANTLMRVVLYMFFEVLLELPGVQMKGLVGIFYDSAKPRDSKVNLSLSSQLTANFVAASIPFRHTSVHVCLKESIGSPTLNSSLLGLMMKYTFPKYSRVRTRVHYGSDMELLYHLQGHGIPVRTCPVKSSGEINHTFLNSWYEKHLLAIDQSRRQETDSAAKANVPTKTLQQRLGSKADVDVSSSSAIGYKESIRASYGSVRTCLPAAIGKAALIIPKPHDVLFGRGNVLQKHPGNVRFRKWLESYREAYEETPKSRRRDLATAVTLELFSYGVRFLKQNEHKQWVTVDITDVVEKICQLFRSRRKGTGLNLPEPGSR